MSKYEPVIGLEIHVQLKTNTKMFCGCELSFGDPPNTHTCPVCLGLPGALPVTNAQAIKFGITMGLAFGCTVAPRSTFDRKNYFYPDSPKGYQISQFATPLCSGGKLGEVRFNRIHLEDDAAKLIHVGLSGRIHGADTSVVDFNRAGTPLAEIVTEPDLRTAAQAREWLQLLRTTLRQLGVSDVNMEEGSLRCDANISIRPVGSSELGTKTELKNMNSFRFIEKGIAAEIARQEALLADGGSIRQATLHFDPTSGALTTLRTKEAAHDYRYFPEPDLMPVVVTSSQLEQLRAELPELPAERLQRYQSEFGLSAEHARSFAFRPELGDFFEQALASGGANPTTLANWFAGELMGRLGAIDPASSLVTPAALSQLVQLLEQKQVTPGGAKQVLDKLVANGGEPQAIVAAEGLAALGAGDELRQVVQAALAAHPDAAKQVAAGNVKAIGPIIGYVMKATKGRADGGEVTKIARVELGL